jgi:hypothetical protein
MTLMLKLKVSLLQAAARKVAGATEHYFTARHEGWGGTGKPIPSTETIKRKLRSQYASGVCENCEHYSRQLLKDFPLCVNVRECSERKLRRMIRVANGAVV